MITSKNPKLKNREVFYWLIALTIMVFFMILIGGLTRLTNSGLSIVDWRPIMGFFPPINKQDWLEIFSKYQKSPEFQIVNKNMLVTDFKSIFWWEWFHRFFARCIALVFFIPMIIFIIQKKISLKLFYSLTIIFAFGFFQALVGWWMVKSGLNDNPYVSSYRLAFHLTNAVIILNILFWLTLNSLRSKYINFFPNNYLECFIFFLILLLLTTIISGAFMAGSDAGKSFSTYPLMNGSIFPENYFIEGYGFKNSFENIVAINFNHRWLATFTFIIIMTFVIYLYLSKKFIKHNTELLLIFVFGYLI